MGLFFVPGTPMICIPLMKNPHRYGGVSTNEGGGHFFGQQGLVFWCLLVYFTSPPREEVCDDVHVNQHR